MEKEGSKEFINNVLSALDDKKVKRKILAIINDGKSEKKTGDSFFNRKFTQGDKNSSEDVDDKDKGNIGGIFKGDTDKLKEKISELQGDNNRLLEENKNLKSSNAELISQNSDLSNKLKSQQTINKQDKDIIEEIKSNNDSLQGANEKLSDENRNLTSKVNYYTSTYCELERIFKLYSKLSPNVYESLARVLNDEDETTGDAITLLTWGVQEECITGLWDQINYNLEEFDLDDIESLKEIFNYFFELFRIHNSDAELLTAEIGEDFDSRRHSKASGSKVQGKVVDVLLKGYRIGDSIQKPVVKVG
ncbi:MAG: hypothetical protein K6F77_09610 [Lachnospiraceae bacterium]|nr:hypothetical protein [Lachnospiraceae bacterium]